MEYNNNENINYLRIALFNNNGLFYNYNLGCVGNLDIDNKKIKEVEEMDGFQNWYTEDEIKNLLF